LTSLQGIGIAAGRSRLHGLLAPGGFILPWVAFAAVPDASIWRLDG
jgi:hypothetical protein